MRSCQLYCFTEISVRQDDSHACARFNARVGTASAAICEQEHDTAISFTLAQPDNPILTRDPIRQFPCPQWTGLLMSAGLIEARANVLCQWFCTSVALIPTNGCPKRELQKAPDLTVGKVLQEIQHVSYSSAHSNSRLQTHMHASVHWQRRELFRHGVQGCNKWMSPLRQ